MNERIDRDNLVNILSIWNSHLGRKVHIIACGGTALTLLNLKASTKDIDLVIPEEDEYRYLIDILKDLGYRKISGTGWAQDSGFRFDLFVGKSIFTTELLESPIKEDNNMIFKELSSLYIGILNYYDLIISKLFRSYPVDIEDCLLLYQAKHMDIDIGRLKERFYETSSYDVSDDKNKKNFVYFLSMLKKKGYKT